MSVENLYLSEGLKEESANKCDTLVITLIQKILELRKKIQHKIFEIVNSYHKDQNMS